MNRDLHSPLFHYIFFFIILFVSLFSPSFSTTTSNVCPNTTRTSTFSILTPGRNTAHPMADTLQRKRVVVVGAGLAGHSAVISIIDQAISKNLTSENLEVVFVDKMPTVGGNSMKASSGINAVNTKHQQAYIATLEDEYSLFTPQEEIASFITDTTKSYSSSEDSLYTNASDPPTKVTEISSFMIEGLANESADAIQFLESRGSITLNKIAKLGGHARPRTHRPSQGSVGAELIKSLANAIDSSKNPNSIYAPFVTKKLSTELKDLISDNQGQVIGVRLVDISTTTTENSKEYELYANAVILTTGGFAANQELIQKYNPKLAALHLPTTNGPWARGDIFSMVEKLGGRVIGGDKIQVHPTSFINPSDRTSMTKFLAPEALRGVGGLLLNIHGKRFVNELSTRDLVSRRIYDQDTHVTALVLSKKSATEFGLPVLGFYASRGFIKIVNGDKMPNAVYEMITGKELDPTSNESIEYHTTISNTLSEYRNFAEKKEQDAFGRTSYHLASSYSYDSKLDNIDQDEYYVMAITPALHYTMGGVEVDPHGRVLKGAEARMSIPIPGLYAAGESTGGLHGNNRLGGNSLLECVVFGIRSGKLAIDELLE